MSPGFSSTLKIDIYVFCMCTQTIVCVWAKAYMWQSEDHCRSQFCFSPMEFLEMSGLVAENLYALRHLASPTLYVFQLRFPQLLRNCSIYLISQIHLERVTPHTQQGPFSAVSHAVFCTGNAMAEAIPPNSFLTAVK